ncbi:MAG TPA: SRPBCC family protein [Bradyrhizobium sp.]|uniref:SRPBCC family protein n=1 Tax=Bradyrhizobium sp. TaxID=376 RepID=UPI002CA7F150|nr:SRPBCC family protein [Bradyrhizobium sp.]HLZ05387.1 SRPBCC family protein [Bradyrhizobium sp.]
MPDAFVIQRETQIAAPPATVFAYLTDPQKILSWMGMEANTEPQPGGLYLIKGVGGSGRTARGAFREVVPVHRLAYSFGWEDSEIVPPGSGLIEIDLIDRDGGTLMRMTHSGLPNEEQRVAHGKGWTHYLGRLAVAASGRNPGPDPGAPVQHSN